MIRKGYKIVREGYEIIKEGLKEGLKMAGSKGRLEKARILLNQLKWIEEDRLPLDYLVNLFPGIVGVKVPVSVDIAHPFELPYGERTLLAILTNFVKPEKIFEFGTFTGTTTKLLADSASCAEVHTLDLPAEEIIWEERVEEYIGVKEYIGIAFKENPDYKGRIIQHRINSRKFDYSPFKGKCDLVFVDASHEYQDVVHDSDRALEIVSPRGIIVWDDYQYSVPGVVRALNEVNGNGINLARIANSRLVVYSSQNSFPNNLEEKSSNWRPTPKIKKPLGEIYRKKE